MLTFANPAFLFALAGLAVPVLIHLINRERAQPLKFPSIRFIQVARLPQEGKRSLRDLLLLLLRMLLYASIILVLAGPQWQPPADAESSSTQSDETVVYLLDASSSMAGWGSWEAAQSEFIKHIDALEDSRDVGLVLFANEIIESFEPSPDTTLLKDIVSSEIPRLFRGRPALALSEAIGMLSNKPQGRLVIISDFQNSNWQLSRWPHLPETVQLDLIPVGDFSQSNQAILSAQAYPATEGRVRVIGRIKNASDNPVEANVTLTTASGQIKNTVNLAAGQTQAIDFLIDQPRDLAATLSLPEDTFAADNSYALWLGPPPPIRVVAIIPVEEEPEKLGEVEFVRKALSVTADAAGHYYQLAGGNTDIDFIAAGIVQEAKGEDEAQAGEEVKDANAAMVSATRPNAVYLSGSGGYLSPGHWKALKDYVDAGGMLLVTPGKSAPKLFRQMRESGVSGIAYLGQPPRQRDRRNPYRIGWLNPQSAVAEIFNEESLRDLYLSEVYQYIRVRPTESAEVILKTEEDDPLILRERVGKGTVLVSAFGWDSYWSDLPLRNSFLPMLRELLLEAAPSNGGVIRVECGERIPANFASYGMDPVALAVEGYTSEPNVFRLSNLPVEVNVARDESAAERIVLSDLRANLTDSLHTIERKEEPVSTAEASFDYWPFFALLAFAFFFLETLLSGWLDSKFKFRN